MNSLPQINNEKSPGFFSNPKNIATTIVLTCLLGVAAYFFFIYVLPILVTIAWNAISLSIAGVILFFLYFLFSNKKFWRSLKYLSEFIASFTLGVVIELNPFKIIESQIEQGYKDREDLLKQGNKVSAKKEELKKKLIEKNEFLTDNKIKVEQLQKMAKVNGEDYGEEIGLYANNVQIAVDYINTIQPIAKDLEFIETFCNKAYKTVGFKLEKAKNELEIKRDAYETVLSGSSVAKAAWKALNGNDDLNQDAEKAMNAIRTKVSQSLAEMKNTMQITSDVIKDIDLANSVRARKGIDLIKQLDAQNSDSYLTSGIAPNQVSGSLQNIQTDFSKSQNRFKGLID